MKGITKINFLTLVFFLLSCSLFAQRQSYFTVVFKATDIKRFLDNSDFDRCIFKFIDAGKCNDQLIARAVGFDKNNKRIGKAFNLNKSIPTQQKTIDNTFKGILILTRDKMVQSGMDGTFDCTLSPIVYASNGDEYVGYYVDAVGTNFQFTAFKIDPSPPAPAQ